MSPILVRPVREQFEHDRVIRVLQARYKRKYEVVINPGAEQNASVDVGELALYPDLVLFSQERSRKMQGTVEVETVESINTLEAMAQWGPFSRLRAAFFLYVPVTTVDTVRRLCAEYSISPAEIWTYHIAIDQVRFTMVHRSPDAPRSPEPRAEKLKADAKPSMKNDTALAGHPPGNSRAATDPKEPKAAKAAEPARPAKPAKAAKAREPKAGNGAVAKAKKAPATKPVVPAAKAKAKAKTAGRTSAAAKKGAAKVATRATKASAKKRR